MPKRPLDEDLDMDSSLSSSSTASEDVSSPSRQGDDATRSAGSFSDSEDALDYDDEDDDLEDDII